jgi:hypothetical protein
VGVTNETTGIDEPAIEAIAERVAGLLRADGWGESLVDAEELARRHGVSRSFVYEHAEELGAIRLGSGARPRLRFDPKVAVRAFAHERRSTGRGGRNASRRRAPGRGAALPEVDSPLMPIRSL